MNTINGAITSIIADMTALGLPNVYDTLPLVNTGALLKARFTTGEEPDRYLAGWTVTWRGARNEDEAGVNVSDWACDLVIEGWRAYNFDTGQTQMNEWLQALLPTLWNNVTLDGAVQNITGVKLVNNEPRISFDVLCHYARIDATALLIF